MNDVAEAEGVGYATLVPLYNEAMELELCFFEEFFPIARAHAVAAFPTVSYPVKVLLNVVDNDDDVAFVAAKGILLLLSLLLFVSSRLAL